jgi:hypothetical protein
MKPDSDRDRRDRSEHGDAGEPHSDGGLPKAPAITRPIAK